MRLLLVKLFCRKFGAVRGRISRQSSADLGSVGQLVAVQQEGSHQRRHKSHQVDSERVQRPKSVFVLKFPV